MAAEFFREKVELNMDFQPTNGNARKFPSRLQIGKGLILIALVSWLIVNTINIHNLKAMEHANHERSKKLVNGHLTEELSTGSGHSLSKIRNDLLEFLSDEIYVKVGSYGYFFKFEHRMTFQEGKDRCELVNGHLVEFDESQPDIQDLLTRLRKEFDVSDYWIGLSYDKVEGSFKWLMGQDYFSKRENAMKLWSKGEPSQDESRQCVETGYDKHTGQVRSWRIALKSCSCTSIAYAICQRKFKHL